ncbi:MAG: hypothetical protein UT33_C0005G0026 [Candidatus Peregrinibacteria bacterium GW2011_GWC2_39_14]|nr:MAG: hypothetical protein US92_C0001G0026 [Candidatus Peregrinibacteria bacterium GW2011_GWA2_38_36]KKR07082.1 MAG: hypothetical protein UT33_C0005G0026 [Candidatus Peregrinibacteria bacterium GW2011_GWC2_39_14]
MLDERFSTHDQLVAEVNTSMIELGIDAETNTSVASVARDLLSSNRESLILFGDETTEALREGLNLTSDSPKAIGMSLRYNDSLADSDGKPGQISILKTVLKISEKTRTRIAKSQPSIAQNLLDTERDISAAIDRMEAFNAAGEAVKEREPQEQLIFLARRLLHQIADKRAQGKVCTDFTTDPTYEEKDTETSRLRYRKGDEFIKEKQQERTELEIKYSVDTSAPTFPDLHLLTVIRKFEDHEQIYLFSAPNEGDMPAYEFRIRKITNTLNKASYFGTIKSGTGQARKEIEFEITKDFYEALKEVRPEKYEILKKRRYFVRDGEESTTTIDRLELNGKVDFSAEVEFHEKEIPKGYTKPSWTTEERKERKYAMVSIARDGISW